MEKKNVLYVVRWIANQFVAPMFGMTNDSI